MPDFPYATSGIYTVWKNHNVLLHPRKMIHLYICHHCGRAGGITHKNLILASERWFFFFSIEAPSRHAFFVCYFLSSVHVEEKLLLQLSKFGSKMMRNKMHFHFPPTHPPSKWKKLRNWTKKIYFKCPPDEIIQSSTRLRLRFTTLLG